MYNLTALFSKKLQKKGVEFPSNFVVDVASEWRFRGMTTKIFAIRRRQLYRARASVIRFKKGGEGEGEGARESSGRGMVKGKERQRQKVSVLRPCGIRPPLRAHDSRKSLRLGIAPPRPLESTCRPLLRVGGRN